MLWTAAVSNGHHYLLPNAKCSNKHIFVHTLACTIKLTGSTATEEPCRAPESSRISWPSIPKHKQPFEGPLTQGKVRNCKTKKLHRTPGSHEAACSRYLQSLLGMLASSYLPILLLHESSWEAQHFEAPPNVKGSCHGSVFGSSASPSNASAAVLPVPLR